MSAKTHYDYDVAIIGGGSGGYAAARTTAGAGLKTVVIEGGRQLGGLCALRGCMPTKALLYTAEVAHLAKHSAPFGIHVGKVSFDFKKIMARKRSLVNEFAGYRARQLRAGKFKFIRANAKFLDAHKLELKPFPTGKPSTLTAAKFVIATGSSVSPKPLPQLDGLDCLDSDRALELKKLPKSMIVLGGGPTACEFAQFFSRLGVRVTIVQRGSQLLRDFDADAATVIENVFRREGIRIFAGTKLIDAKRKGKLKAITFEHKGKKVSISAEEILFALGRTPNTPSLDLQKAGVKTGLNGGVTVNARMRTSAPHIYAAGDCTGQFEVVHIAVQQGEAAGRNIIRANSARMDYRLMMFVAFTEPQLAYCGLTEKQATERGIRFISGSYPFNDHGKSILMNAMDGFVKLLADPKTGEIIGGECVGPIGGELIHEIVPAMAKRMTVHELAAMPHYHPTLAEIWTWPAEELAEIITVRK